jgi:SAM-dependent methyltransferase
MPPLPAPRIDPTPIFEHFRGSYGSELLTAAVAHFDLFGRLTERPRSAEDLAETLGLARRPAVVLLTALRAMGLLELNPERQLVPGALAAEHLAPGSEFDVSDYVGLAASSPGVLEMVERLRSNRPAGLDDDGAGTAFIYRQGVRSAMEESELARHFTLALAGRAKNVAPVLAERVPLGEAATLLDVAGGTGIYSVALLLKNPQLRAVVLDRPEVLRIAAEFAQEYGVADRLRMHEGDMFADPLPAADVVLLSNVLHDWDEPECRSLVQRCADVLPVGGRLLIHDVLLNDALDGPLPIALYSAALFTLTEGRAYSGAEFQNWLRDAGLEPQPPVPTLVHCAVIAGEKRG